MFSERLIPALQALTAKIAGGFEGTSVIPKAALQPAVLQSGRCFKTLNRRMARKICLQSASPLTNSTQGANENVLLSRENQQTANATKTISVDCSNSSPPGVRVNQGLV